MRNLLIPALLLSLISFSSVVNAQDEVPADTDEAPYTINTTTSSTDSRDRLVLEMNWNYWLNTPDSFNIQGKSRGFNFHFYYDIPLGENFAIAPGVGIGNSNIFHQSFLTLDTDTGSLNFGTTGVTPFDANLDFKKNKISLTYFEVPVELRFRTKKNDRGQRFKVAVGFKGGLVINTHTKYVGTDTRPNALPGNVDFVKYKEHRIQNVANLRYGITGRVGYGNINLQAFYGLSDVFNDGAGPTANALEVGISFNPF